MMGGRDVGDRLPGLALLIRYEDGMPDVSRFEPIHGVQKALRTSVKNSPRQAFRRLDIREKLTFVAPHGETKLISGKRHSSRPTVALVDRTRPTDHLVDPKIAAVSKIELPRTVTHCRHVFVPGNDFPSANVGVGSRRETHSILADPSGQLVLCHDQELGCHCMTVLGHAVLCFASKMRRHCVSEDSDAVAHNPKI